jgi:hypothetical protein
LKTGLAAVTLTIMTDEAADVANRERMRNSCKKLPIIRMQPPRMI